MMNTEHHVDMLIWSDAEIESAYLDCLDEYEDEGSYGFNSIVEQTARRLKLPVKAVSDALTRQGY